MAAADGDEDDNREVLEYFLHYVLHTGARWRGAIGRGEVYVYDKGRLRRVRQWTHLEPTTKDDIHLKLGALPEPYRRHWAEAMTYEDGVALLAKHGFQAAVRARRPPRKAVLPGLRLQRVGSAKGLPRALAVSNAYRGFRWKYRPRSYSAKGQAAVTLALRVRTQGQPPKPLVTRTLSIDRAFAGRHAARWRTPPRRRSCPSARRRHASCVPGSGGTTCARRWR